MWYMLCLMIVANAMGMEQYELNEKHYYDKQLETSFYEREAQKITMTEKIKMADSAPLLEEKNKKIFFNPDFIRAIIAKLSPTLRDELRGKFRKDMSPEEQVYAVQEVLKNLDIQADNFTPAQKKYLEQQIALLTQEKQVLTTVAKCGYICAAFWIVCVVLSTYYYLGFS